MFTGLIIAGCAVVATVHYVNGDKAAKAMRERAAAARDQAQAMTALAKAVTERR